MQPLRGLIASLNRNGRFKFKRPDTVVDYLVIGGGVIGLAIAQRLCQKFPRRSIFLIERHAGPGEETSSRNSEVIHSGLYYPVNSLKTILCLRGRDMIYRWCQSHKVPYQKTGKLVVARPDQVPYIENLHKKSLGLEWSTGFNNSNDDGGLVLPTKLLSGQQVRHLEPDLSHGIGAALLCPETGIIDSHSFIQSLEKYIIASENGNLVYSSRVVRVDPNPTPVAARSAPLIDTAEAGWVVQISSGYTDGDSVLVRTLINASGLSSALIINALLPPANRIAMYYAKGSYASYHGPGIANVSHLIYPCPEVKIDLHSFQSLGSHLTLDLAGRVRFGPDIDWIEPPCTGHDEKDADFWQKLMIPDETRLSQMHDAVIQYLPGVDLKGLQPDYCGMRPKLVPQHGGFQDFVFRTDYSTERRDANIGQRGGLMISLLGIESPGLTASLAIAEYIERNMLGT